MAYDDLTPSNRFELALSGDMTAEEASNRIEKILAGADIEPSNRLEYFLKLRVSGGGGGGGEDLLKSRLEGNITSYTSNDLTEIKAYGFYSCDKLESVDIPNVAEIGESAFMYCSKLATEDGTLLLPSMTKSGSNSFRNCSAIKYLIAPVYNASGPGANHCSILQAIDILHSTGLNYSCWSDNPALSIVILRGSTLSPLQNTNVFSSTPFASGGSGGTLYVPQALISQYQAANNWSTILGYANNQIKAIEGSIYENAYADGTPIT